MPAAAVPVPSPPTLIHFNPKLPYPNPNPNRTRSIKLIHTSVKLSATNSPAADFIRQLSVSSVVVLGLGLNSFWALTPTASARIPPPSSVHQQQTLDTDAVGKFENVENIEDEELKAKFDRWKSKTYPMTVPLRTVALNGSLPSVWIKEFLKSQGKRVQFRPEFRQSLKKIFYELSDPFSKGKIKSKSAAVADLVTLGDSWLNFAINKGLIEPIKGAEDQEWFHDLSDKWKVYMRRSSDGNLDSQGRIWAVPYRWGSMVIAYNKREFQKLKLPPVEDWSDLWRPELAGKISMVDSPREIVGLVLKYMEASYNTTNIDSQVVGGKQAVLQQLELLVQQVRLFDSQQYYLKALGTKDVWVAVGWSSDVLPAAKLMSNVAVIVPKSGASLWADFWAIPTTSRLVSNEIGGRVRGPSPLVHQWVDFCLQPERALPFTEEVIAGASPISFEVPVKESQEQRTNRPKVDTNLVANVPPAEIMSKCEFLEPLSEDALSDYQWLLSNVQKPNYSIVYRMWHVITSLVPNIWFKTESKIA
ncbi:hypothetical protein ACJIZ3_005872 [Penstemon smallii]|uniref:Uncharacterized protein n=1 Tax=Penstemon smallii TaxID=265156 RepID=A0ABD3S6D2_9LAMI